MKRSIDRLLGATLAMGLAVGVTMSAAAATGPVRLTAAQMDGVTAGTLNLNITADAYATYGSTITATYVIGVPGDHVDFAGGTGYAAAEGDHAVISFGTNVSTDSPLLISLTRTTAVAGDGYVEGRTRTFSLAVDTYNGSGAFVSNITTITSP